ncbi:MAG: hypothetical protein VX392_01365 [Verrucomicrobiota bacterium]|nr:hypothetical protein [Verrucomicrobiota bacterium]
MFSAGAQAQVKMTLEMGKKRFLPRESMPVQLKIVNFSGQTLMFGEDDHWLQLNIQTETGEEITPIADPPPVKGRFTVESSIRATKEIDIAPYYALEQAGRYTLTAKVAIRQWGKQFDAKPVKFDVTNGTVLWEQAFGLPLRKGDPPGQPRQIRRYVLQQAKRLKAMSLYARVDDGPGGRVHRVMPVCAMVSFNLPKAQVDPKGNLHVLCQSGGREYNYSVIDPDGQLKVRRHYLIAASRPRLDFKNGEIIVVGGFKLTRPDDLPSVKKEGNEPELITLPGDKPGPIHNIKPPVPLPTPDPPRR